MWKCCLLWNINRSNAVPYTWLQLAFRCRKTRTQPWLNPWLSPTDIGTELEEHWDTGLISSHWNWPLPQSLLPPHCKVTKCKYSPIPCWRIGINSKYLQLTTMESCHILLNGILECHFMTESSGSTHSKRSEMCFFRHLFFFFWFMSQTKSKEPPWNRNTKGDRIFFHNLSPVQLGFNGSHLSYTAKS